MDVDALRDAIVEDVEAGLRPVMVHVAAGSTSTGAMDDIAAVAEVVREWGVWLHVDAAWAGVAAVCPEHRDHLAGVEAADSFVTNPHKWLLTTFDCSTFWVRDRAALTGALSILPEYLRNAATESGEVVDYRDWHPQLGRRFRAIKLWAVLRTYGLDGLRAHIRSGVALAEHVADLVAADDRFEMVTEPALSLVVFRLRAGDEQTLAAMEAVNASGRGLPQPHDRQRPRRHPARRRQLADDRRPTSTARGARCRRPPPRRADPAAGRVESAHVQFLHDHAGATTSPTTTSSWCPALVGRQPLRRRPGHLRRHRRDAAARRGQHDGHRRQADGRDRRPARRHHRDPAGHPDPGGRRRGAPGSSSATTSSTPRSSCAPTRPSPRRCR